MIKLLSLLWNGHSHKWVVINKEDIDYKSEFTAARGIRYTLQCEHCGKIKTKLAI